MPPLPIVLVQETLLKLTVDQAVVEVKEGKAVEKEDAEVMADN